MQTEFLAETILVTESSDLIRSKRRASNMPKEKHLGCAPLATDKVTRIVSARNSVCTAPIAKSIGCNSLDSDIRRPKRFASTRYETRSSMRLCCFSCLNTCFVRDRCVRDSLRCRLVRVDGLLQVIILLVVNLEIGVVWHRAFAAGTASCPLDDLRERPLGIIQFVLVVLVSGPVCHWCAGLQLRLLDPPTPD